MSHGVYSITTDGTALINEEAIKLEPILGQLNTKQILYIIWVYDYIQSPLRKKPLEDRKRFAKAKFFPTLDTPFEERMGMPLAINTFKSFIYDEKYETCETYKAKISQLQKNLMDTANSTDISNIMKSIDLLRKKIDEIESEIDERDQIVKVKGDRTLSMIELWQRNRSLSKKVLAGY